MVRPKKHHKPQLVKPAETPIEPPEPGDFPDLDADMPPDPNEGADNAGEPPPGVHRSTKNNTVKRKEDMEIWQRIRAIPPDQWGESGRYYIYLYQLEPFNNIKTQGMPGYLMKYYEPVLDPQVIMEQYGSGKYHIKFKQNMHGLKRDKLIGQYTFEIVNPLYPPKLPVDLWRKDERNARWLAMMPPKDKAAQPAAQDSAGMFKTFLDIQDRIEDRVMRNMPPQPEPNPDPADQFSTVVATAKDLLSMAQPKGDSDMMKFLLSRLEAAENRTAQLMDKLFDKPSASGVGASDPVEMFDKMMDRVDKFQERVDKFKERITPEASTETHASRMNGWQEFALECVKGIFSSQAAANLSQGFLIWMSSKAMVANPNGAPASQSAQPSAGQLPAPAPAGTKLTAQQLAQMIGPQLISPLMLHLSDPEKDGYDLAQWVIDGKGQEAYEFVRDHGVDLMMESFKLSPAWPPDNRTGFPGLSSMETRLREVLTEFCAWPPPEDQEDEETEAENPPSENAEPIDLTAV